MYLKEDDVKDIEDLVDSYLYDLLDSSIPRTSCMQYMKDGILLINWGKY